MTPTYPFPDRRGASTGLAYSEGGQSLPARVERRIRTLLSIPPTEIFEPMVITKYDPPEASAPKFSAFDQCYLSTGQRSACMRNSSTKGADLYTPHLDAVRGVPRNATVLIYLTSAETGGQTVFPLIEAGRDGTSGTTFKDSEHGAMVAARPRFEGACDGSHQVLSVPPRRGAALVFFNVISSDGTEASSDRSTSLHTAHAACPVLNVEKWIAQVWHRYVT